MELPSSKQNSQIHSFKTYPPKQSKGMKTLRCQTRHKEEQPCMSLTYSFESYKQSTMKSAKQRMNDNGNRYGCYRQDSFNSEMPSNEPEHKMIKMKYTKK